MQIFFSTAFLLLNSVWDSMGVAMKYLDYHTGVFQSGV